MFKSYDYDYAYEYDCRNVIKTMENLTKLWKNANLIMLRKYFFLSLTSSHNHYHSIKCYHCHLGPISFALKNLESEYLLFTFHQKQFEQILS